MERDQRIAGSPSNFNHLAEDLVTEILIRLPVKSILRFRSVSKSWFSIINSPSFINQHLKRQKTENKNNYILVRYRDLEGLIESSGYISMRRDDESFSEYYKPEIRLDLKYLWMYGCCNGLVCVSDVPLYFTSAIFLWNPTLGKLKTLPRTQIHCDYNLNCPAFLAFGFLPMLNDYKVVRIVDLNKDLPLEVDVYTLSADSWHRIDDVPPYYLVMAQPSLFMGGVAYWPVYGHPERGSVYFILSFNMNNEVFQEVMLPMEIQESYPIMVATEELLYLFHFEDLALSGDCDLWVLDWSTMGNWTKLYSTNLQNVTGIDLFGAQLCFRKNGELLLGNGQGILVSYNLPCQRYQYMGIHVYSNSLCAHPYIESLLLLDRGRTNTRDEAAQKESSQVTGRPGGWHQATDFKKGNERRKSW